MSIMKVKNPETGEWEHVGTDGYTPVKGVDYYTEEDKAEFEAMIADEMAQKAQLKPEFANSVDECSDTTKLYVLPDGYLYGYMTKTVTHAPVNQITKSIDTDGTPYNGGVGYIGGNTIHLSTGADYPTEYEQQNVTGYIPCAYGDVIRTSGIDFTDAGAYKRICFYDSAFACIECFSANSTIKPLEQFLDESGGNLICDTTNIITKTAADSAFKNIAYVRVSAMYFSSASIVTINESTESTTETVTGWMNTERAFVPADYEDRILALEANRYAKSRHHGKVCVCFGDSIVGNMASPNDYPTVLGEETGMTVYNVGFGGCRMSASMDTVYNAYSMVKLVDAITTGDWTEQEAGLSQVTISHYAPHIQTLKNMDWDKVDFITIGYGTNDIANFVTVDHADDPMDVTTVLGGLRYSVTALLTAYPHLKVLILTPIYRYFNAEGVDSDDKEWYNNREFTTWVDGILDAAKELRVPAVDLYRTLGFNKLTRGYYFPENDGTHPNEKGLKVMAGKIAGRLLAEY